MKYPRLTEKNAKAVFRRLLELRDLNPKAFAETIRRVDGALESLALEDGFGPDREIDPRVKPT